jgi:hypothetical protein
MAEGKQLVQCVSVPWIMPRAVRGVSDSVSMALTAEGRIDQVTTAGNLMVGSSLTGAMLVVSRIFRPLVGGLLELSDHRVALPEQLHIQVSFG